ncbi:hypothetical protein RhiirA1_453211 [Rhizophagus irregularis]|uniref:Uncharacterized protein n=1 Tax=Rhizophagus irregularis TaxID=588596 RepID=A0A2I1FA20_9GLOM|nr:hypothetical protein RhiirA1_453211 [Rhizophagus irregularis]PKY31223.1 hypothetical protein RhiirB3_448718 [Rhizophagus irregularis]
MEIGVFYMHNEKKYELLGKTWQDMQAITSIHTITMDCITLESYYHYRLKLGLQKIYLIIWIRIHYSFTLTHFEGRSLLASTWAFSI